MPDLCLTLAEASLDGLQRKIADYAGRVALIEVRLDYLHPPRLPELPSDSSTEFLATLRPVREGGRYRGLERDRLQLLRRAGERGFSWIDLEHDVEESDWPDGLRIVRSVHCFESFPSSLDSLCSRLQSRGDVSKIAVQVSTTHQLADLLTWMSKRQPDGRRVVLGMGDLGQPSRFLGALMGNRWTYVCERSDSPPAAGQFSLEEAEQVYRLAERGKPRIFGVLGNPVAHSLSPRLHNALFRHYGMNGLYLPVALDELAPWFDLLKRIPLEFGGFSVTLPFKSQVREFLSSCESPLNSINTLVSAGGWRGFNTDYDGFLKPLQRRLQLEGKRALVLGNGGVALTAVQALQDRGCQVTAAGRDAQRITRFAERMGCSSALFEDLPISVDLCVNATPLGQHPRVDETPLLPSQMDFEWAYDLVYRPRQTHFLQLAQAQGIKAISGLEMFVEQAALQFQLWTGIDPDRGLIEELVGD